MSHPLDGDVRWRFGDAVRQGHVQPDVTQETAHAVGGVGGEAHRHARDYVGVSHSQRHCARVRGVERPHARVRMRCAAVINHVDVGEGASVHAASCAFNGPVRDNHNVQLEAILALRNCYVRAHGVGHSHLSGQSGGAAGVVAMWRTMNKWIQKRVAEVDRSYTLRCGGRGWLLPPDAPSVATSHVYSAPFVAGRYNVNTVCVGCVGHSLRAGCVGAACFCLYTYCNVEYCGWGRWAFSGQRQLFVSNPIRSEAISAREATRYVNKLFGLISDNW